MDRFTAEERISVRDRMLAIAQADPRVSGGAAIGSFASGHEDLWSDLDLTFGIHAGESLGNVLLDWTNLLDAEFGVVHFFDLASGPSIYRVILLRNGLELDLSVSPASEFRARGEHFSLLFGTSAEDASAQAPPPTMVIGLIWHHLLHASAALSRGKYWLAEYWIHSSRDQIGSLYCLRRGLPTAYAKGLDRLDSDTLCALESTLCSSLEASALSASLERLTELYLTEMTLFEPTLASRLRGTIELMLQR